MASVEKLAVAYLKTGATVLEHVDPIRIATRTPPTLEAPWVRVTALAGRPVTSRPRHLIGKRIQVECYGGADVDLAQGEADDLSEACAAWLALMDRVAHAGAVITGVAFNTDPWRLPDEGLEPARERYMFDLGVYLHDAPT